MKCVRCHKSKAGADFYANDRTCKECRKALVRANRKANVEFYREYDRQRAFRPDRVKARKIYAERIGANPELRQRDNARKREWIKRNRLKRIAHLQIQYALRKGTLVRECCEICGKKGEAHHEDYSKPFEITWLCRTHHMLRHREIHAEHRTNP